MASPTSSYAPSSSAVIIPTPGRSILKRPPPPQQSFFSRFSKFLPTQNQPPTLTDDGDKTLKRAHFILPELVTVYPISASNPPSMPTLKDEKRSIEQREAERRRRVVRGNSVSQSDADDWWSLERVESFYRECCASRDDVVVPEISAAFKAAAGTSPRTVDFSGVQLSPTSSATLSDVFTIEWGLRRLTFRECDLDDRILKPILHALLIPGTLSFFSVASNRRLKAPAFRLIGAFVAKAKNLQFLDLSQNSLDKKSIEYVAVALRPAPEHGLSSLKLDDCFLKPQALEALAHTVRTSSLKNISLRYNRINATGAVAIALMIRDYPDVVPSPSPTSSAPSTPPISPPPALAALPATGAAPNPPLRSGPVLPPPRHPTAMPPQTTYTPYIPRARRAVPPPPATNPLSPTGQQIPLITSSAQGGITTRHAVPPASGLTVPDHGPSAALLDKVRALDALPRLGALRTLDLRGNDIRTGITYIAQVLKRNRTLKVLNLSENKLDVQGLVSIAEALKYNSCLETLDLSKNPCCGPGLDGVQSLRTAFTLNTALKRLFLSSTSMTSAGAIALAEFLPESMSLLHLDLTMNDNLDLAGVMALSSGLKGNHVMRCLDLNIPPDDEEMARMCRDILNTCVRNTEEAERSTQSTAANGVSGRGQGKGVWGMIEESELAKSFRKDEEKKVESRTPTASPEPSLTPSAAQTEMQTVLQARRYQEELEDALSNSASSSQPSSPIVGIDPELVIRTKSLLPALAEIIQSPTATDRLDELLNLNDSLTSMVAQASPRPRITLQGLGMDLKPVGFDQDAHRISPGGSTMGNGHVHSPNGKVDNLIEDDAEEMPSTPKIDKGKGKAPPEPEVVEPVMSPTNFVVAESDDEEGREHDGEVGEDERSPTDRSRRWVAEEGEVFRKGNKLLGPEEMEGEYAGEELRIELLEAMVERPPPRAIVEDLALSLDQTDANSAPTSPVVSPESPKASPRPYVSRRTSSASITTIRASEAPSTPTLTENGVIDSLLSPTSTSPLSPSIGPKPYVARRKSSNSSLDPR
ncbi:RNI-like protein, partial [Auriscalpium vulgare]